MAVQTKVTLKGYFNTGDRPTEQQFADFIDSTVSPSEDLATTAEAQAGTVDTKFMTPKKVKESIISNAPVKTVNSKSPTSGNVALAIADIPTLQTALNAKQDALVSGTSVKTLNGTTLLGSGDFTLTRSVKLASNLSVSTTTRSNATGMSFTVAAGKQYLIQLLGEYQTALATTGGSIGFVLSSGAGTIKGTVEMQGPTASEKKLVNAISSSGTLAGSFMTSTGVATAATSQYIQATLYLECTTAGTFQLQWGSEVASSAATLMSGTAMVVTLLN